MAVDMLVDVRAEFSDADHPFPISASHFSPVLDPDAPWMARIRGIRA